VLSLRIGSVGCSERRAIGPCLQKMMEVLAGAECSNCYGLRMAMRVMGYAYYNSGSGMKIAFFKIKTNNIGAGENQNKHLAAGMARGTRVRYRTVHHDD